MSEFIDENPGLATVVSIAFLATVATACVVVLMWANVSFWPVC